MVSDSMTISKNGTNFYIFKILETCSTPEGSNNNTNNSINDPQPQYEPLSDDES